MPKKAPAEFDAERKELQRRIEKVRKVMDEFVRANVDPAKVKTRAICAEHGVIHLGKMRFALAENPAVTLAMPEPDGKKSRRRAAEIQYALRVLRGR
jgi:hypothetical protein